MLDLSMDPDLKTPSSPSEASFGGNAVSCMENACEGTKQSELRRVRDIPIVSTARSSTADAG